jgi:F-type H+-transporting ATPase subunit epsilon
MLKLEIVTPEKRVLEADVDSVTVPTATGEAGILPNHAPLVSALKPGILAYTAKGSTDKIAITGGFVEVNADKVAILADAAETAAEVDVEAAKAQREAAEKELSAHATAPVEETEAIRERIEGANAKLQLAAGKS